MKLYKWRTELFDRREIWLEMYKTKNLAKFYFTQQSITLVFYPGLSETSCSIKLEYESDDWPFLMIMKEINYIQFLI